MLKPISSSYFAYLVRTMWQNGDIKQFYDQKHCKKMQKYREIFPFVLSMFLDHKNC
jgi:hypothetical protein